MHRYMRGLHQVHKLQHMCNHATDHGMMPCRHSQSAMQVQWRNYKGAGAEAGAGGRAEEGEEQGQGAGAGAERERGQGLDHDMNRVRGIGRGRDREGVRGGIPGAAVIGRLARGP